MIRRIPAALGVGWSALRGNLLRTLLSTLGVIIGVASLVAVLSLGDGMERLARAELERTTDVQTIAVASKTFEDVDGQRVPLRGYPVFTREDAEEAGREIPSTADVSLSLDGRAAVELPATGRRRSISVLATLADADRFMNLDMAEGRYFTPAEERRDAAVVVVSSKLAAELRGESSIDVLDRTMTLNGRPYIILGILAAYSGERTLRAYIPFSGAHEVFSGIGSMVTPTLLVRAVDLEHVPDARRLTEDWIATRFGRAMNRVTIQTSDQRLAQATQGILTFKLFMGAITGISLLVGGIGIMNILLASVTERTREIGIRKAAGARRMDIVLQFLLESLVISGVGSFVGICLGLSAAFGLTAIIRTRAQAMLLDASFSWTSVSFAALAALSTGLLFGTYPARRAGRLSPIDGIRHE
ncbi:MAG TPA: ABC transporter permease [Gemmatimonadaceae bacterium]|nr:ABC transporter permease [Gemmatimonadaceae bacterium]